MKNNHISEQKGGNVLRKWFPPVGMRMLKSAAAIELCYLVSFLRGNTGIVFYSHLAALWCIQMYTSNTWKNAGQRMIGTVIGALYGLLFLSVKEILPVQYINGTFWNSLVISGMIVLVLYTTVVIKKKQASYFSCVVFLSIVVNHVSDAAPYLFVWNRFLDTVIGIIIGVGVNTISLPRKKRHDILFISGLDDTLLNESGSLSDYSRVELNRMLDEGANFTISTMRTPASLLEPMRDIRLKLPVIAMDGAVLFDISEKRYLKTVAIDAENTARILALVEKCGLSCFTNVVVEDLLIIYYDELKDECHKKLVGQLRKAPLRNYVRRQPPEGAEAVYFMMLYPHEITEHFYRVLEDEGITGEMKVLKYDSNDFPGYSYIKIYHRDATKDHMIQYLKNMLGIEHTMTFGSIPGQYDEVIKAGDMNHVVHVLRKQYEPVIWKK